MGNEERYRERVKAAFDKFLVSPFIEYKPYSMSDEAIVADAKERSDIDTDGGRLQRMQGFASIYRVEGAKDSEYNGNNFKQLVLRSSEGRTIAINFSDFRYYNSFYVGKEDSSRFGYHYDGANARFINLLDGNMIPPEMLVQNNGYPILLGYDFNTVNRFEKLRTCCRMYSLTGNLATDAEIIRKQILRAQAFALLLAAKYPSLCIPKYDWEDIYPYMYDITKEVGSQYTSKISARLYEVAQALREHGLTYEHTI